MTSARRVIVGVETGGTKTLCRVESLTGDRLGQFQLPTETPSALVGGLTAQIDTILEDEDVIAAVGLASFGPVIVDRSSADVGRILATPKVGWTGFNLANALSQALDAPVAIDTDVSAAAIAEQAIGAGRGCASVAYVTVGTGIGGGLAVNGVTIQGALHPEVGHLPLRRAPGDDFISTCPFHPNCAEGLIAGPAVGQRLAGRALEDAPEVRDALSDYLGQICSMLLLAWSPQRIVLGGGVMHIPDLLGPIEAGMRAELNGYGALATIADPCLALAELEHAGLEGSLILARKALLP